jgi:hypothetical protein
MKGKKVRCDAVSLGNALQTGRSLPLFSLESLLFLGRLSPIIYQYYWYLLGRNEFGALGLKPYAQRLFRISPSPKIMTASEFVTRATRFGGSCILHILLSQTSSIIRIVSLLA